MDGLTCLERYKFWMLIRKGVKRHDYVFSLKLISIISKRFFITDGQINEPNGGKGANCVYAFSKNNRWFDFRCNRSRVYSICELPVIGTGDN